MVVCLFLFLEVNAMTMSIGSKGPYIKKLWLASWWEKICFDHAMQTVSVYFLLLSPWKIFCRCPWQWH